MRVYISPQKIFSHSFCPQTVLSGRIIECVGSFEKKNKKRIFPSLLRAIEEKKKNYYYYYIILLLLQLLQQAKQKNNKYTSLEVSLSDTNLCNLIEQYTAINPKNLKNYAKTLILLREIFIVMNFINLPTFIRNKNERWKILFIFCVES